MSFSIPLATYSLENRKPRQLLRQQKMHLKPVRVILVDKKDKCFRFPGDYIVLNDVTRKDAYLIQDIRDMLDNCMIALFSQNFIEHFRIGVCIRYEDIPKTAL